jgi:SAM-dependent methyltransferase
MQRKIVEFYPRLPLYQCILALKQVDNYWLAAMKQNWHEIWGRRGGTSEARPDLQKLLYLNGYDSGAGRVHAGDFREYVRLIADRLEIKDRASVYEVGCGAGALLFGLQERFSTLTVGGCDYAPGLVEVARRVCEGGEFAVAEAVEVNTKLKYDLVLAQGVFLYFPDLDYAARVLEKMIEKSNSIVAVMEVPHAGTRAEAEQMRREQLTVEEYERKYEGLKHQYYWPEWFGKIAERHNCTWEHFGQIIPNYLQNPFRFNVIISKKC